MSETENVEVLDPREGKPSASGLQRIALCPGSWLAERALPEETSEAAEAGTRLHEHMELGTLPEDAAEAEAVEWCRVMEAELVRRYLGCELDASALVVLREQRWWDGCRRFSGQADVVYVFFGMALVVDYKFGRVAVPVAANNLQLAGLSGLAFDVLASYGVELVFGTILQPFVSREVPRVVRYQRADVPQLRRYLYGVINEAERPGARRVPGEEQCRYCRAKVDCPACGGLVRQESQVDVAAAWPDWAPEKKAEAVRLAGLAKKWAEAVERKAKADLKDGLSIPGWSLGAGRRSFKVTDAQGAFAHLNGLLGITGEEFAGCCQVQISRLDKVVHARLAEHAPEGTKQLVKKSAEWLREALVDFGAESVSEPSLKQD